MRTRNRKTVASLLPAVAVAASVMAAGIGGNVLGTYVNSAPQVGHIVTFDPSSGIAEGPRIEVRRQDESTCVLDLGVMHRFGGSLVVETRVVDTPADFRVHWAGRLTSNDSTDCGSDAIIMVARRELDLLASSAGGYGAGQDRAPALTLGTGNR
jgi:hypothetical protein